MCALNAMQVALEKSVCQMHKCKCAKWKNFKGKRCQVGVDWLSETYVWELEQQECVGFQHYLWHAGCLTHSCNIWSLHSLGHLWFSPSQSETTSACSAEAGHYRLSVGSMSAGPRPRELCKSRSLLEALFILVSEANGREFLFRSPAGEMTCNQWCWLR